MIDLHCHMLPGIDDGARDLDIALEMARIALDDGITLTVCTPHIYPGLYQNDAAKIRLAVGVFERQLEDAGIALQVTGGADIQVVPELTDRLRAGIFPTLHGSRYFLFEPPHHAVPTRFKESIFDVLAHGYVPVITHPERLTWIDKEHYGWLVDAARQGAWLQVTAGAITGRFGDRAQYWGQRMLAEGMVHLLATDAHGVERRPPLLAEGREEAAKWVGTEEADRLVDARPRGIIDNSDPTDLQPPPVLMGTNSSRIRPAWPKRWLARMFPLGQSGQPDRYG
jgi:protein-tyrosine phosphatase